MSRYFACAGLFELRDVDIGSAKIVSVAPLVGRYGNYTLIVTAKDLGAPPNEVCNNLPWGGGGGIWLDQAGNCGQ